MRTRTPLQALARLVAAAGPFVDKAADRPSPPGMSDNERDIFAAHFGAVTTLRREKFRYCRVCGCSEHDACERGCSWVDADLCSACADRRDRA